MSDEFKTRCEYDAKQKSGCFNYGCLYIHYNPKSLSVYSPPQPLPEKEEGICKNSDPSLLPRPEDEVEGIVNL